MNDDPSTFTAPEPTRPRTYVLSGDRPEPRASVALAVLGEMLTDIESRSGVNEIIRAAVMETLREARNRVLSAEARFTR